MIYPQSTTLYTFFCTPLRTFSYLTSSNPEIIFGNFLSYIHTNILTHSIQVFLLGGCSTSVTLLSGLQDLIFFPPTPIFQDLKSLFLFFYKGCICNLDIRSLTILLFFEVCVHFYQIH